jgi:uncharacterized membrane protein YgcG
MRWNIWSAFAVSMVLLCVGVARAGSHGIHDDAKFFSDDARNRASEAIDDISQQHHRDLLIDTVATIPNDKLSDFEAEGKQKFFPQWATERARQQKVNGVYILICKDPAHLEVAVGNNTEGQLFTIADRNELAQLLLKRFRDKQFDEGLVEAAQFVQQKMKAHAAEPQDGRLSAEAHD